MNSEGTGEGRVGPCFVEGMRAVKDDQQRAGRRPAMEVDEGAAGGGTVDGAAAGGAAAGEIGHPSAECVPSSALLPCSVISLASHDYTVSDSKVFYHAFAGNQQ